jgi:2-dehydro-3-deoxyphosphogluconate aldolase / (4S)-4-hydroxy-2-oxoglutarate aldolase
VLDLAGVLGALLLLPVVVIDDADDASGLAEALQVGGLPCAEVTLRTPAAPAAIRLLAAQPGLLVGAGTVCTGDQAEQAIQAGARFVVSPGFSDPVVARCRAAGVPVLPGVATATELIRALDAGFDLVKLFPAGVLGGPAAVRALAGPFPDVGFVPTGGIGPAELSGYLREPAVTAVGGSWMVAPDLLRAQRFDQVARLTGEAVAAARQARP